MRISDWSSDVCSSDLGLFRVVGDGVFVDGDMSLAQGSFGFFAGNTLGAQINQHDVAFGTARYDAQAALDQSTCQHVGVLDDLGRVLFELGRQRFFEGNRLGGNDMHERTALNAGEEDRKSTSLNSSQQCAYRMPSSA